MTQMPGRVRSPRKSERIRTSGSMKSGDFQFGFVARSIYVALLWGIILVSWVWPDWLNYYIVFVIFLGIGLRPLLIWTGLSTLWEHYFQGRSDLSDKKSLAQRDLAMRRDAQRERIKHARKRDPRLPKNW